LLNISKATSVINKVVPVKKANSLEVKIPSTQKELP